MKLRIYILSVLLLPAMMLMAAPRAPQSLSHWLGLSVTGVESNVLLGSSSASLVKPGGGAQVHLLYEMHKGGVYFNLGLGADYMVTNSALESYSDEFDRVDFMGEALMYRYVYSDYQEQQRQVRLVVPIQIGGYFGDWVYAGIGAAFRTAPFINSFTTTTRMLAEGEYDRFIQPIRNTEAYGYWPEAEYSGAGKVLSATHEVAVEAEVGVRIPLPAKKVQMRVGAYLGYDMPIAKYNARATTPLVDYSAIDANPYTQTWTNTQTNIRFNSMLDTPIATRDAQRIRVGVRATVLLDVTHTEKPCMCLRYIY